jgi:hypothetical protein
VETVGREMTMRTKGNAIVATIFVAAALVVPSAAYAQCRATSPDFTIALIELYTSEGCDSCPPADRWFSKVTLGQSTARSATLAFHVDYWDRLGWRDRFGNAAFTARQYEEVQRQRGGFAYTPQVLIAGRDFPPWRVPAQPEAAIAAANARPPKATIELVAQTRGARVADVELSVRVPEPRDRANARVHVALVQSALVSDVGAGENAGKRLSHDHVVREWRAGLKPDAKGEVREHLSFTLPADTGPLAIVAFAENAGTGDVLQALTLPFCAP